MERKDRKTDEEEIIKSYYECLQGLSALLLGRFEVSLSYCPDCDEYTVIATKGNVEISSHQEGYNLAIQEINATLLNIPIDK